MNDEQNLDQLPNGWKRIKVSSVAELFRGINYTKEVASNIPFKDGLPILRANNINGELNFEDLVYVPKSLIKKEQYIKKGDILFAMSSGSKHLVGKSAVANIDFNGSYGAFCALLRISEEVNKKYISYVFKGNSYRKLISEIAKGTNINNLKREHILDFELPLPSLPIQNTIVSKIEELFSELDKGIEYLRLAQQQLKTYRQAVLKWAFEGRLTNENVRVGELPERWKIQKLNDIGSWKGGGTPTKSNKKFWENGNILWVSPKDMKSKEIHDTIDKITADAIENSSAKIISKGSILFVVRSGILRRTLPVAITICDVTVNQDIQAFTPEETLSDYVYWYVQAKNEEIRRECSKDGTTVESIESALLKNYLIPICSLAEQEKIIKEVENRLSVADNMDENITQGLQKLEALRQSILKEAFQGQLI